MSKIRAGGLLMYRVKKGVPEVLLVHPGGPFWQHKDEGAWSVPKGQADEGENDLLEVGKREFREETGFAPVPPFHSIGAMHRPGKTVEVWAFEGDCDTTQLQSNLIEIEWPPRSGKKLEIPEVDKGEFFMLEEARKKLSPYQAPIIDAFESFFFSLKG
jgi:predicted NUDIX family NTP pyrophosphohydrolase